MANRLKDEDPDRDTAVESGTDPSDIPAFIADDQGVQRPNPKYTAIAQGKQGKFKRDTIYEFAYLGCTDCKLPDIEEVEREIDGKKVKVWIQSGDDITVLPGQTLRYLGWIGNAIDSDFVLADHSAEKDGWEYPWTEDQIIHRFKRVPPEIFDRFVEGYFELFGDRRRPVQDFYFKYNKQYREQIAKAQNAV